MVCLTKYRRLKFSLTFHVHTVSSCGARKVFLLFDKQPMADYLQQTEQIQTFEIPAPSVGERMNSGLK